jgi:sarcosine oxidase subunit alpha
VAGDPGRLRQQIFLNLGRNALQVMEGKGGRIEAPRRQQGQSARDFVGASDSDSPAPRQSTRADANVSAVERLRRPDGEPVRIELDGNPVRAYHGESVAVALLANQIRVLTRSLKYHRPRSFFCLEGSCGGCLMRIGSVPNLRACLTPCQDGLTVAGQNAYPSPELDVLEAVDWMFPRGLDHHTLMTGSKILNAVANKVVRQLSGLGRLPDRPPTALPPVTHRAPDVAVVGAGPAGLAAATAAAHAGASVLLVDQHARPGGSLLGDPRFGPGEADRRAAAAGDAGVEVLTATTVAGFFPEDQGGVLALAGADGLIRVHARRTVYATGGYVVNRPFVNNDRPGVMAARAVGRLLVQGGVKPAHRVCVVGQDDYARALGTALADAGCEVIAVDEGQDRVVGVRGRTWVSAVVVESAAGTRRKVPCDLVAVSATPAPAFEAPRQHGCAVRFDPAAGGFAVVVDDAGQTSAPDALACGDVCGYVGPAAAAIAGARAGAAAAALAATPARTRP